MKLYNSIQHERAATLTKGNSLNSHHFGSPIDIQKETVYITLIFITLICRNAFSMSNIIASYHRRKRW